MSHLRRLRSMLDELELRLDARVCLQQHGRDRYASRIRVDDEFNEFLQSVNDLIAGHLAQTKLPGPEESPVAGAVIPASQVPSEASSGLVRIQLKLSPSLVRVLQAVRQQHVRASDLVEEVLWSSPRIRDTARLAGINQPSQIPAA